MPQLNLDVDIDEARKSLVNAAERTAALIRTAPDCRSRIPGSDWTVGEVAVHLTLLSEYYAGSASGETEPFVDVSDVAGGSVARSSATRIEAEAERDLAVLARRLEHGAVSLVRATEGRSSDEPVTWNGQQLGLAALLGVALGECLMHGRDLARALSREWPIDPDDARLVLSSALPLLPLLVNGATAATVNASYDLRVRGGVRLTVRVNHGQLVVAGPAGAVDCHISAEPISLLLVAYGRRSQWVPALSGRIVAWGRKPWLGLRLTHYLVSP